jgi:hypothetical protein
MIFAYNCVLSKVYSDFVVVSFIFSRLSISMLSVYLCVPVSLCGPPNSLTIIYQQRGASFSGLSAS